MPDQKLSAVEALRGFTSDAAYAAFAENEVGRLAPGFRADLVILDGDPLTVPAREIPRLRVLSTWLDGRAVYQQD